jgi:hypothetical protein
MDEYVREVERKEVEGLTGVGGTPRGNLFTGEDYFDGPHGQTWMWTEEHLAEIRSLAEHPPEHPQNPRISRQDFLGPFSAEQLKRTYFDLEDPYPSTISRKWLGLWLATGRDPEATAALLTAFYEYPEQKTLSAVPPESWWKRWREATARLDPEVIRVACDAVVRAGIGERTSYKGAGSWFSLDKLSFAAVYGVTVVATSVTCEKLACIVREPRKFGEPVSIAAARALERTGTREALFELQTAKMRLKNKNVLRPVEDCLIRLADQRGTDPETLADLTAEGFGLGTDGVREWRIGDYAAEVRLFEDGKVTKGFRNTKTGKTLRSVPKAAKEAAPEITQEITAVHKKLRSGYALQKARLEAAMVSGRIWKPAEWRQAFAENPLMDNLARRLVWRVGETTAMPSGIAGWQDAEGEPAAVLPDAEVRLMHPVAAESVELVAWRRCIVADRVVQPFKQVFRETYVVTPAERETRTYSNRFAAHVVNHRRVYALLKVRGWSGMYMLGEHEEPAHKDYPNQMVCALFDHSGEMDIGNVDGSDWFVLDRVWFVRLSRHGRQLRGGQTLPLWDVHPVVFSEAMRDVDLLVATAGMGTDPNWEDWETRRTRDAHVWAERRAAYEREQAATADQRAALLRELLGPLGIEERVRLEGRFAVVRGNFASYRVHLGSGNVHTEPDGRYVCIVPARGEPEDPYLPFEEGDLKTAEIISKILALSADEKIEDESILRQIRP